MVLFHVQCPIAAFSLQHWEMTERLSQSVNTDKWVVTFGQGNVEDTALQTQNNTVHYTKLYLTSLHYTALHYTALHCTTLHYTALHYMTLHCTALHYTALHCNALHYTSLHCTALCCTTLLNYTVLQCTTLQFTLSTTMYCIFCTTHMHCIEITVICKVYRISSFRVIYRPGVAGAVPDHVWAVLQTPS